MGTLSNITPKDFHRFLELVGCRYIKTEGGHEKWTRQGLTRPIIIQTHIKPIPEFIIKNTLRTLGINRQDFEELIKQI